MGIQVYMDKSHEDELGLLVIEESDERAEGLFELLSGATPTRGRVTRARHLSAFTVEAAAPVSVVLLSAGARAAMERFFAVRTLLPELPVVVLFEDDGDALALRILEAGAEDCLFRDEVTDGAILWRALRYAVERHRLRAEVERGARTLRAREEMFRQMIESQADAVVIVDGQRRVRFANPAAERLLGERADTLAGQRLHLPIESGRTTTTRGADNDRLLEIRAVAIEWESMPAVLASLRDITESVHSELEALRASQYEMLGVLAGGIAHDLNNFLTCLCLNVHFALQVGGDNPRLHEILVDMQKALPRASELIQQLLTFAKGGSPVRGDAPLADIIRDTTRFALRGSKVCCELAIPESLWTARIDTGPLSQILNNLVANAKQAMPKGGTLRVQARNVTIPLNEPLHGADELRDGPYVHVRVQDHGHGIAPAHLERIFEPYFTTRSEGNGLGLAICRSILQALGGHIAAESGPSGSTFHVYVPALAGPVETSARGNDRPRILFMDDEEAICRVVARILDDAAIDVDFARDGFEALEKLERAKAAGRPFDAAILDVTVPGGMGAEATLPRLRSVDPALQALVSSASLRDPLMANPRAHGFQGSIAKPYNVSDLTAGLRAMGLTVGGFDSTRR